MDFLRLKTATGKIIAIDDGLCSILEGVRKRVGAYVSYWDGIGVLGKAEGELPCPSLDRARLDCAPHANPMARGKTLREFVYGDVVRFALLKPRYGFPAHNGEDNPYTYPEL